MSFGQCQAGLSERPVNGLVSHRDFNNGEADTPVVLTSSVWARTLWLLLQLGKPNSTRPSRTKASLLAAKEGGQGGAFSESFFPVMEAGEK